MHLVMSKNMNVVLLFSGCFTTKCVGTPLHNIAAYLPDDMVQQPGRSDSSKTKITSSGKWHHVVWSLPTEIHSIISQKASNLLSSPRQPCKSCQLPRTWIDSCNVSRQNYMIIKVANLLTCISPNARYTSRTDSITKPANYDQNQWWKTRLQLTASKCIEPRPITLTNAMRTCNNIHMIRPEVACGNGS